MLKDRVWVENKVQLKTIDRIRNENSWMIMHMMHNGLKYIDINVWLNIFNVYSPEKQNGY